MSTQSTFLNEAQYRELYQQSIEDPILFWKTQGEQWISWFQPFDAVLKGDFNDLNVSWYVNGKLNACYNCVDRHLPARADKPALIWESDDGKRSKKMTYNDLYQQVCQFANVLKQYDIKKGDRVCIYMPMIPEVVVAMLACARIGAIHSVVFGGFSPEALKNRILDAECKLVITANEGIRGGKIIPLKKNVDEALTSCPDVTAVVVVKHTENNCPWDKERDHWYHEVAKTVSLDCPCIELDASDPLYILYTSGSTGKPKGIVHATGGYMVYTTMTFKTIFNYQENDIYWCTADVGWVTGHSYLVYGPLSCGASVLIFEGIPTYPTPARYWEIVDKYQVNIFYSSPTAVRALRREGDQWVQSTNRKSLKLLGTVGEPINPEVWEWYAEVVGDNRCPIVDTWWQTETGGILISALPEATPLKAGSAAWPFFGIDPAIVDAEGKPVVSNQMGNLVIRKPWPGMMKTIYGDTKRFQKNYFEEFPGNYLTGDEARCDEDGYYWIAGRNDDVLKVSGHRIGTGELENAILNDPRVAEAAVVGVPDEIKGESIYAFVTLKLNEKPSENLKKELIQEVRNNIGAIAAPKHIQWADALPKTRSGKIMRRLLRKIANHDLDNLGDISTLADPEVVENLIKGNAANCTSCDPRL